MAYMIAILLVGMLVDLAFLRADRVVRQRGGLVSISTLRETKRRVIPR